MTNLCKDIRRNIGSLGVIAAGYAVEHGHDGAAQRVGGDAHDGGVALQICKEASAYGIILYTPEDQNEDQAQHAESLYGQTADAAAAESDLYGFAD